MEKKRNGARRKEIKFLLDIDRAFVVAAETTPDQWRKSLEVFFEENETGLDHLRYLKEISKPDVDRYFFMDGYEVSLKQAFGRAQAVGSQKTHAAAVGLANFTMPYESNGCFRYALP